MIYMFFAHGFEEVEAIATLDVIRRAGIDIQSVGIGSDSITGSHGITVKCDLTEADILLNSSLEGIILPGGMPGTNNLNADSSVHSAIDYCSENGKLLCAICAAPLILGQKGLLNGKKATCFPGFEDELKGAEISDDYVCVCEKIITAKGMGSAVNFGIAIVAYFKGESYACELKQTLQCS